MSRFSRNWDKIFKNGIWDRVPPEFAYLGKLLKIFENGQSRDGHVPNPNNAKSGSERFSRESWVSK